MFSVLSVCPTPDPPSVLTTDYFPAKCRTGRDVLSSFLSGDADPEPEVYNIKKLMRCADGATAKILVLHEAETQAPLSLFSI